MSSILLHIAALLIAGSVVLGVVRLVLGRTLVDRVAAIDMLTVVSISLKSSSSSPPPKIFRLGKWKPNSPRRV